jgi:hypothetical protein
MTGLLAAVRLGSAGRLDCPSHMGSYKSEFFDGMICSKIRDVQILKSRQWARFSTTTLITNTCRKFRFARGGSIVLWSLFNLHSQRKNKAERLHLIHAKAADK